MSHDGGMTYQNRQERYTEPMGKELSPTSRKIPKNAWNYPKCQNCHFWLFDQTMAEITTNLCWWAHHWHQQQFAMGILHNCWHTGSCLQGSLNQHGPTCESAPRCIAQQLPSALRCESRKNTRKFLSGEGTIPNPKITFTFSLLVSGTVGLGGVFFNEWVADRFLEGYIADGNSSQIGVV